MLIRYILKARDIVRCLWSYEVSRQLTMFHGLILTGVVTLVYFWEQDFSSKELRLSVFVLMFFALSYAAIIIQMTKVVYKGLLLGRKIISLGKARILTYKMRKDPKNERRGCLEAGFLLALREIGE